MAVSRRNLIKALGAGGALTALATSTVKADAAPEEMLAAQRACREFLLGAGGRKPVALPAPGSTDLAAHSRSDVLFWSDQLTEHGMFLAMLLPGAEACDLREQALTFQDTFLQHFAAVQAAPIDATNFRDVNRHTIELVKPFIDFKLRLEEALRTGQIRGLVYPTFAAHIAAEGEHFVMRLDNLSRGNVEFDLAELVAFWSRIMGEHALFAAHLLDPREATLIEQARTMAATFQALGASADAAGLAAAGELILGFKETAEAGIEAGQIQSIIHPAVADHIRREALKFRDELRRTLPGVTGAAPAPAPAPAPPPGAAPAPAPAPAPAQVPRR
jgi:hypothetical protein